MSTTAIDTPAPTTPAPLNEHENALVVYLKRSKHPTLDGVLAIYAERVAMDADYMLDNLPFVVEWVHQLCTRLDLLGASFASSPVSFGTMGVMRDAAPSREWALLLPLDPVPAPPDRVYWHRILSVLCSRLHMAKVSQLPGYDPDASFAVNLEGIK